MVRFIYTNMNHCIKCGMQTTNPKFCSRSCSASYTNSTAPKRKLQHQCKKCCSPIMSSRTYCKDCSWHGSDITLKEAIYTSCHRSSAFALIRSRARVIGQKLGWVACQVCGYNKHIEICHRKQISEFPESTLLSEINDQQNLIALCRNHHWEFDHNQLDEPLPEFIT